jgi:hypothetical protein
MTRDEMEIWQGLRAACLEIIEGTRKLREHAEELAGAELKFYHDMERLLPDAEATMHECQARLGQRTPRRLGRDTSTPEKRAWWEGSLPCPWCRALGGHLPGCSGPPDIFGESARLVEEILAENPPAFPPAAPWVRIPCTRCGRTAGWAMPESVGAVRDAWCSEACMAAAGTPL